MTIPVLVSLFQAHFSGFPVRKETAYRAFILLATFAAYMSYHVSRRPLSVVKNVLNQNCSSLQPPPGTSINNATKDSWCNWEPFSGSDANRLLGILDSCFLFSYACFMFVSGVVAERVDLRYYLSLGMLFSGIFTYLFGMAYSLNIHSLAFFIVVQLLAGAVQSTGWPSVVTCVGNWFGKTRRGFMFGVWNAHLYVGNILGAYIAGVFVETNWGLSFMVPGLMIGVLGFLVFLFLVPCPEYVDCTPPTHHSKEDPTEQNSTEHHFTKPSQSSEDFYFDYKEEPTEKTHLLKAPYQCQRERKSKEAITLLGALKIPGVVEFSLCLFFCKLVSYTFLFWLPRFIEQSTSLGSEKSAYMSIPFDMGGIAGGIIAGLISDRTQASAITCSAFLVVAIPILMVYGTFSNINVTVNIAVQAICGALVNGPYALITTAVSADLGTHPTITAHSKALATVTAIIDGMGSIGAAVGPLLAGIVSETGWNNVFYMMMVSNFLGLVVLLRVAYREIKRLRRRSVLPTSVDC